MRRFLHRCRWHYRQFQTLWQLRRLIVKLTQEARKMAAGYDNIVREVSEQRTINGSVITLLDLLKARVDELLAGGNGATDEQLQALADDLDAGQGEIAAAVERNTPAAPPTP